MAALLKRARPVLFGLPIGAGSAILRTAISECIESWGAAARSRLGYRSPAARIWTCPSTFGSSVPSH